MSCKIPTFLRYDAGSGQWLLGVGVGCQHFCYLLCLSGFADVHDPTALPAAAETQWVEREGIPVGARGPRPAHHGDEQNIWDVVNMSSTMNNFSARGNLRIRVSRPVATRGGDGGLARMSAEERDFLLTPYRAEGVRTRP